MVESRWPVPPLNFKDKVADSHIKVELDFIPVEERLPEDIGNVYVLIPRGQIPETAWYSGLADDGQHVWRDFWRDRDIDVTHWAEIPEMM